MTGLTPGITAVSVLRYGVLRLTFADGATGEIEMLGRMRGFIFEQALALPASLRSGADNGSRAILWPGGADLAPDTLYERISTGLA